MKIGAMVESFRSGYRGGVEKAASLGVSGVQAYATVGDLYYENMTPAKVNEALDILHSNGLVFSAICGDFGVGFKDPEKNKIYVEKSKRVVDLALELNCKIITTHIGTVPVEENETKKIMREACHELAVYADSVGAAFAVETGPELATVLCEFLDSLGANGVRVNFDPANLVMVSGDVAETAVKTLGKYIVHTHAKDGIKLKRTEAVDGLSLSAEAAKHNELMDMGRKYLEMPLGQGNVNFDTYLPALKSTGFDGFLTIEREVGTNPEADIQLAASFLAEKIAKYNL